MLYFITIYDIFPDAKGQNGERSRVSSRLVKNVVDTKFVKNLAKYRGFPIGSLRTTGSSLDESF